MPEKAYPVAARIAAALAERIVTGELAPGAPLRQDHVAAEFGASHVPAREAFQMLRAQGLAVGEPRRGMRVAPLDAAAIREIMEMRSALELLALRHAAPRMTTAHHAEIDRAMRAGEEAPTLILWEAANRDFHEALVAPCRMPRLLTALEQLRLANSRIILASLRSASWQPRSNDDHRRIADALRRRDIERAAALLARHIHGMERTGTAVPAATKAQGPDADP